MFIVRKAMKNLLHNKGRNMIMFMMMFIVTLASVVSLTVYNMTAGVKIKTENYYAGEVAVAQEEGQEPAALPTVADYKRFVDSDYLRSYVFYRSIPVNLADMQVLDGGYKQPETNGPMKGNKIVEANAQLYGMLDEHSMDEFTYGDRTLVEGHFPANAEECMISSELAGLNHLQIGDTLHLTVAVGKTEGIFEIAGIYSDATVARSNSDFPSPQFNRRNDIITSYDWFDRISDVMLDYKSFLLNNSADLNAFQDELYGKGLAKSFYLKYDTDRYDEAVEGINETLVIVTQFFGLIAGLGVGVVFLINVLALRERKYEIGVLRAIGMSKFKVMALLICEMLFLAILGSVIALIAGIFVNPSAVAKMKSIALGGHLPSALISEITGLKASFSGLVGVEVILLSVLLALAAGSMTVASITRFDPAKILSERN